MSDLRIIAGEWRGRRIAVPPVGVRPTGDRVREAWMSIVQPSLDGARVLDIFAGSGALGLEALSRGAVHCDFVERDAAARKVLEANLRSLGAEARATVHGGDALAFIGSAAVSASSAETAPTTGSVTAPRTAASSGGGTGGARWDVAFADPPYQQGLADALATRWLSTVFATIFGIEHEVGLTLPVPTDARATDRRVYGATAITIYRATS